MEVKWTPFFRPRGRVSEMVVSEGFDECCERLPRAFGWPGPGEVARGSNS